MLTFRGVSIWFLIFSFCLTPDSYSKPEPLAALFQNPAPPHKKGKVKKPSLLPLSEEYQVYLKAKALTEKNADVATIESSQKQLLNLRLSNSSRTIEKDADEVLSVLELKKAIQYTKAKNWKKGLESFTRGLGGLAPFKWIFYWREEHTNALSKLCTHQKKKTDEECLAVAKRVVDAFPKLASETRALRDLPAMDLLPTGEINLDRLSQSYSEKTEKDEVAFQEVLDHFLNDREVELLRTAKEFNANFPRSILRFRANFLCAEMQFRRGEKKDAEPLYRSLIEQIPLSFYAIVSSERLGLSAKDRVKADPLQYDPDSLNFNPTEKATLEKAKALYQHQNFDEVGIELDSLSRVRNYTTDSLLYLMKFATLSNQNLVAFKFVNELIQRRYEGLLNQELMGMIFPDRYWKEISAQVLVSKIDPVTVISLMKQESGFKAPILSSSGALGLMQLMPFTAIDTKKDVVLSSLKDPISNIAVGTKYIASLYNSYEGNIPFALAAYNAGPHRVAKWRKEAKSEYGMIEWIEAIPYKETRDYVMSILRNRYWYQVRLGLVPESVFSSWKSNPVSLPSPSPTTTPTASASPAVK